MAADGNQNPDEIRARAFKTNVADNIVKHPKADEGKAPTRTFQNIWFNDDHALADDADFLLQGLIARKGVSVWWSKSGTGKTFFAQYLSLRLTQADDEGETFLFGHRALPVSVAYVCAEGGDADVRKRIEALKNRYGKSALPFVVIPHPVLIDNAEELAALARHIRTIFQERGCGGPGLIVFDTASACMTTAKGNDNDDVALTIMKLRAFSESVGGPHIMIIHHTGHDGSHERGGYSWRANTDASGEVDGEKITIHRCRIGPQNYTLGHYSLEKVELPQCDRWGTPFSTLVFVETDPPPPAATPSRRMSKTAQNEALLLEAIHDLFATAEHVELAGINHGPPVRTIERRFVVDRAIRMGFFTDKQLTEDAQEQLRSGLSNFLSGPSPLADRGGTLFSDTLKSLKIQGKIYADRERIALPNEDRT